MSEQRKAKRIFKKRQFNNFDRLVIQIEKTGNEWDRNTIPLNLLKNFIDELKVNDYDESDEVLSNLYESYNSVLDTLYDTCRKKAKEMRSKSISIEVVKGYVALIKDNFNKGSNE